MGAGKEAGASWRLPDQGRGLKAGAGGKRPGPGRDPGHRDGSGDHDGAVLLHPGFLWPVPE